MPRNVEIKARVDDLDAIRGRASAMASGPSEIIYQTDTFFVVQSGRLKVRDFRNGTGELIAYDRANDTGPKQSTYLRVASQDPSALVSTLARAMPTRGIIAKRREVFMVGRARVHVDQVEGLGSFVEIEVVLADDETAEQAEREARRLIRALGVRHESLIASAYIDLLEAVR
jgi:predicted adenylyl cyclase CyaB